MLSNAPDKRSVIIIGSVSVIALSLCVVYLIFKTDDKYFKNTIDKVESTKLQCYEMGYKAGYSDCDQDIKREYAEVAKLALNAPEKVEQKKDFEYIDYLTKEEKETFKYATDGFVYPAIQKVSPSNPKLMSFEKWFSTLKCKFIGLDQIVTTIYLGLDDFGVMLYPLVFTHDSKGGIFSCDEVGRSLFDLSKDEQLDIQLLGRFCFFEIRAYFYGMSDL